MFMNISLLNDKYSNFTGMFSCLFLYDMISSILYAFRFVQFFSWKSMGLDLKIKLD